MFLDNPLSLLGVLVGAIFMITGFLLFQFPPQNINSWYGYRSMNSMKDERHWAFAQKKAGKWMIILGLLYGALMILLSKFIAHTVMAFTMALVSLIMLVVGLYLLVERSMKKELD